MNQSDVLVLGATGFTGRLVTRYLAAHSQFARRRFTLTLAARSQSRLHTLVQGLALPPHIHTIQLDVENLPALEKAVQATRVVINTVGPFWRWGTPVVSACARNGVHYVDLTGETPWIKDIIIKFDYLATKTRAIIIPSCGLDSIPSDISAFLSNKTLKAQGLYSAGSSTSAHRIRMGVSGGSMNTVITFLEDVPADDRKGSMQDYSLSPVIGTVRPAFQLLYSLPIPGMRTLVGTFFFMQPVNKRLVQRTFGLLEAQAFEEERAHPGSDVAAQAQHARYGPAFAYDEFIVMPSKTRALLYAAALSISFGMLTWIAPVRWLVKKWLAPGDGPSDEDMKKGFIETTNITTSTSVPLVRVKTVIKGNGDPGYLLSAVMVSESALALILPLASTSTDAGPDKGPELSALARRGGVLTPMSALGDVLVQRLAETGLFEFESGVVEDGEEVEGRKDL